MHRIPLDRKLRFGFGLALAVLIAVSVFAWTTIDNLDQNQRWVIHTQEVIVACDELLVDMQDVETGVRGYYITGEESFLEPFTSAIKRYYPHMRVIQNLVQDNPVQGGRLETLHGMCIKRIEVAEDVVRARRDKGFDAAGAIEPVIRGRMMMEETRTLMAEVKGEERRLRAVRIQVADASARRAKLVIPALIFVDFLVLVVGYFYITSKIKS